MSVVSCTYIQIYTAPKIVRTNLRRCDQNGLAGSAYVVIHDIEKCSKQVGHFQRLPTTFQAKKCDFNIPGCEITLGVGQCEPIRPGIPKENQPVRQTQTDRHWVIA